MKTKLGLFLKTLMVVFSLVLNSKPAVADTYFNTDNVDHLNVFASDYWAFDFVEFRVLAYDYSGYDDKMDYVHVDLFEGGTTYTRILEYAVGDDATYSHFSPKNNDNNNGYIQQFGNVSSGDRVYTVFRYYYPQRVIQTKIQFKISYNWAIDGDEFFSGTKNWDLQLPLYEGSTTSSTTIKKGNDIDFAASTTAAYGFSSVSVYSDANRTALLKTISLTSPAKSASGSFNWEHNLSTSTTFYTKYEYKTTYSDLTKTYVLLGSNTDNGFKTPTGLTTSYQKSNKTVELSWSDANSSGRNVKYYIKKGESFITPSTGITSKNYTDPEINHWSNYTYTVFSTGTESDWTQANVKTELSASKTVTTNPNDPDFSRFRFIAHPTDNLKTPYVEIIWDNSSWIQSNLVKLYRKPSTASTFTLLGEMPYETIKHIDNNVSDNSKYYYKIVVDVFGHVFSKIDSVVIEKTVKIKSFNASKNTIPDRIRLQWEIDRLDLCKRFEIYRSYSRDSSGVDVTSLPIKVHDLTAQTVLNMWEDNTAVPGLVYHYFLKAFNDGWDGLPRITTSLTDIGFRMPSGTVTGRITYGGGTAVNNVSLYVNSSKGDNNLLYKSLKFNGEMTQKGIIELTKNQHGCVSKGFSFQSWLISSLPKKYCPIIEVENEYSIGIRNDSVLLFIGAFNINNVTLKCKLDTNISQNDFFQLSVSLSANDSLKIYLNGNKRAEKKISHISTCSFVDEVKDIDGKTTTARTKSYLACKTNSSLSTVDSYSGNLDEIRLWSRAITDEEVIGTFNHYIVGNEDGLIAYWRMDEGINKYVFDCSKTDQEFNEHSITLFNSSTSSTTPTIEQLSIKGITDSDGNYIIRGIPFSGEGSTYSIKPILGTHKFEPTQQLCYISPSSLVHSSQNFNDKSSFPVQVQIKYENTNYPVKGVSFSIDENPCSKEGKLISTGDDGKCTIEVPIGEHYIRANLNGHVFANDGRYPTLGTIVVDENLTSINFTDKTLVIIAGRVVGGNIEAAPQLGFKKSKANIGQASIQLQPLIGSDKYTLNTFAGTRILNNDIANKNGILRIKSIAKVETQSSVVSILTDSVTGEYLVKLPPIEWQVNSVTTLSPEKKTINIISTPQTFTTNPLLTQEDTTLVNSKIDSFSYHVKKIFTYRVDPTIVVEDKTVGSNGGFGETQYLYKDATMQKADTVKLYTVQNNKTIDYTSGIGKPVFIQGRSYIFKIEAYESYIHPNTKLESKVPLKGAKVKVENEIGILSKPVDPDINFAIPLHEMNLLESGLIYYRFLGGFPNLGDINAGLGIKISIENEGKEYFWGQNNTFRAIVLGVEPIEGTNFVTSGPLVPLVVLRDPPGSNSYAYMEKGTTLSYSFSSKDINDKSISVVNSIRLGPRLTTGVGFGLMVLTEMEAKNTLRLGYQGQTASFTGTSTEKTLTFTERIQTSSSTDFVGSLGDVYIGTSTNIFYSECKVLELIKNGNQYILGTKNETSGNIEAATEFRYSQYEILNAQIPYWKNKIKEILITKTESQYNSLKNQPSPTTKNVYITTLNSTDPNFGKDISTYAIMRPVGHLNLKNEVDSMANQIKKWENVISANEMIKDSVKSSNAYDKTNLSFDAGVNIERSYNYVAKKGTSTGDSYHKNLQLGTTFGFQIAGIGVQLDADANIGWGNESESESSTENSITFGYVLEDPDLDNRFSINVYKNKSITKDLQGLINDTSNAESGDATLGSYIFELMGGQSSCPHEAADSSIFYTKKNKNVLLANGTQPLDAPYIKIQNYSKTNIPNGRAATYVLELGSKSIVQAARAYILSVEDESNPNGAIISVDGSPLTSARIFYVAPGQILTKTLTLTQTKQDVLDYKEIKLLFSSICDESIVAEQIINASYVPSCSDITLSLNRLLLNKETGSELTLTLKDFNQEYKNFLGIRIQYKEASESENMWKSKTLTKYGLDSATIAMKHNIIRDMVIPESASNIEYKLSFNGLNDGVYQVKAFTLCEDGLKIVNNYSEEFNVVKDMVAVTALGNPSPSNGIITPESEISVTFNEAIQTGNLIYDNFEVKGVLNGVALQHAEGLALDGTEKSEAFTESTISLQNSSFSLEAWVRASSDFNSYGTLFSIGESVDKIELKMKKDALQLLVNNIIVATKTIEVKTDWQYVSLNYNANNKLVQVHLLNSNSGSTAIASTLTSSVNPIGRFHIGKGFKGNIHQVSAWNRNRLFNELTDINVAKSGKELNIIGYWAFDEANAQIAADKARGRNMTVNASWFIEPNGKSIIFNGTNQAAIIKSSQTPLSNNDNFSLDFWFKGKSINDSTVLFSCGKGIGDIDSSEKLSIGFNPSGNLIFCTMGNVYELPNTALLDTTWHHFALSVKRGGNSNIYIDGQQRLQLASTNVGGMASDSISLGCRRYSKRTGVALVLQTVYDQYFNGQLDEVRIWNSALSAENFKLDMRSRLSGTESGLIAYYPFEEYTTNAGSNIRVVGSLNDCSPSKSGSAKALNTIFSDNTPGIKVPRPKEKVNFNWTATDNKIVFNLIEPLTRIENCILEFAINKVVDKNGNKLGSPIKWTVYVNNNRLVWLDDQINLVKQVLEQNVFKTTIVNNSGKYEDYVIDGLPDWLSVDKSSGSLNPLEKTDLTFTVDKSTNIGSYESRVTLTGNNNIQEILPVSLKVTGTRPDWAVVPSEFEYSMNVIGQIKVEGVYQEDEDDILAAFIDNRCVGVANPKFDKTRNNYTLFMDIYSPTALLKPISFSLWDAGTGRIYPDVDVETDTIKFVSSSIIGSVVEPRLFNATDKIEQQFSLKQGWNWISTNVVNSSLMSQFKSGMQNAGIQIKSKSGYLNSDENNLWSGSLESISQTTMYLLKTNKIHTLKLQGTMAKTTNYPISINQNWNYIGYIPQFVAPVKLALSDAQAMEGDMLKSHQGFATYSSGSWIGSLQYMTPGLGYMYFSKNANTYNFKYPSQYLSASKMIGMADETQAMKWSVNIANHQMSMTITGVITIDGIETTNSNIQLGVFIGEECRGTITLKYVDVYKRYIAFLLVWGNATDVNKKLTFRSFNSAENIELIADNKEVMFVPDNIIGTGMNPYEVKFSRIYTGNNADKNSLIKVYPNLVDNQLFVNCYPDEIESIEIMDNLGHKIMYSNNLNTNKINVSHLAAGAYNVRIKFKGNIYINRFIKK